MKCVNLLIIRSQTDHYKIFILKHKTRKKKEEV